MKSKKTIVLAGLVVILVAAMSLTAGGDKAAKLAKMKADLNLSDQQVSQIDAKITQLQPLGERVYALKDELKALQAASTPDQKAISAKESELMAAKKEYTEKWNAALKSVLSAEQWAKYEQMQSSYKKSVEAKRN
jgi:hypothetical protein